MLALLLLCLLLPAAQAQETAAIETASGTHVFSIELADTPALRQRGLSFRQSLPADHGMLFAFAADQEVSMWMQDTYVPLDIIFILADGTVHRIARDATPFSTESIPSRGRVRAVLEIAAGGADRIGLRPGDRVRHPIFSTAD